jgi:hypothetical protein
VMLPPQHNKSNGVAIFIIEQQILVLVLLDGVSSSECAKGVKEGLTAVVHYRTIVPVNTIYS